MKKILIPLLALLLVACGDSNQQTDTSVAAPAVSETDRLNAWFAEKNEERLAFSPVELTQLGRKELYDQIDDMSVEAVQEQLDWMAATVAELRSEFDYEQLDLESKTSYDLWVFVYELQRDDFAFYRQEYLFSQMGGAHEDLPLILMNYHQVETLSDMEAYISRIEGASRALLQQVEWAQDNAERGTRPPQFAYELVTDSSRGLISGQPFDDSAEDSSLWEDINTKIGSLLEAGTIDQATADRLTAEARDALIDYLQPAYQEAIAWFEQDINNADAEPQGVHALPNGVAFYNQMLRSYTTTDLTAEEIHQIGLDEVERLRGEMELILEEVGFDGELQAFFQFLNTDEQFLYPDNDDGRQQYLDDSATFINNIKSQLPEYFGILPKADIVVKRVEAFREQDGAPAHYFPSSPDGSVPGVYYAHLSDMSANPRYDMESVAYHEGLPGHHMQIAISRELESVPDFRTQFFFGAYVEGWGLYSEQLAYEMGGYEDPYSNFGRLSNEIWRAIRLVVDTGMHALGWSEQQAIDFFAANAATPLPAIIAEVRRYLVLPGQATSYKIGMLKILELRERAREQLGDAFDIRDFHDVVLGGGSLPLDILDRRVDNYIAMTLETSPPA